MSSTSACRRTPAALSKLQTRFALLKLGGEVRVVDRIEVADVMAGKPGCEISFYKKQDGELLMKRTLEGLSVPSDPKVTIPQFWINPGTHMYNEVAFSPLAKPPACLNYWVPPAAVPVEGNWSFVRDYLREVVCDGDAVVFCYLLKYLAHMLQRPEEKPGIFIVLLGGQGTGKGAFFTLLRKIWARTTLIVADADGVIGQFNAALERNYVVCMDEALFSGDKKALERLKSLVTEPVCRIEQKYQPSRTIDSYHRFFAASNNDHFAHIDRDDRRFLFLRVSSEMQGNAKYFTDLFTQFDDPNVIAAMAHDLLQIDLTGFNVRQRPKTTEHQSQKLLSLTGFDRYWYEVLLAGDLCGNAIMGGFNAWDAGMFVPSQRLMNLYKTHDKQAERHRTLQSTHIAAAMKKLCPSAVADRFKSMGEQQRGYRLPSLAVARQEFERAVGVQIGWGEPVAITSPELTAFEIGAMYETFHLEVAMPWPG